MALSLKDRLARQSSGATELSFNPTAPDEPQLVSLPMSVIDADPNQPRQHLGNLADLALSIREHGVLQPIIVETMPNGRYRILAGERRFAAARNLKLATILCIVRTVAEQSRLALQLIENLQRQNLHPVEEAQAIKRLGIEFSLTDVELAKRLGKSKSDISQTLRILDLPDPLLEKVQTSELPSKSVLLEIAKETDPERQAQLCELACEGKLNTQQARAERKRRTVPKVASRRVTIKLEPATVVIQFHEGDSSPERVRAILELALQQHPLES